MQVPSVMTGLMLGREEDAVLTGLSTASLELHTVPWKLHAARQCVLQLQSNRQAGK